MKDRKCFKRKDFGKLKNAIPVFLILQDKNQKFL